jgi:hypothetical protein
VQPLRPSFETLASQAPQDEDSDPFQQKQASIGLSRDGLLTGVLYG